MAGKLDDKAIKTCLPPTTGYTLLWDSDVSGFGCRITAAGARSFILSYRVKGGPRTGTQRRHTIGSCSDWSTVAARSEARRLRRWIDQGGDPVGEREHDRHAPTVSDLCDRYLTEHVEAKNKPRTRRENRRIVERIIKPRLGRLKVEAVEYEDVTRLHHDLWATPRQANLTVALLSKMFNLAERWRDDSGQKLRALNSNPCKHIQRYPENARDRYPKPDELSRIGVAMRDMEAERKLEPEEADCIRILAFVGCRLSEGIDLDLADVDFRSGEWTLRDAKAGDRTMILGAPALAILASLGRTTGRAFVRKDGRPITAAMIEKSWAGEKPRPNRRQKGKPGIRDRAAVPDLRIHDLRHGVGTYAGAAGMNAFVVRDLLGHRSMAMTGRYVSKHIDPLRAAADAVSRQIAAAMNGPAAEVVDLPKSGRR
jgi:integrase